MRTKGPVKCIFQAWGSGSWPACWAVGIYIPLQKEILSTSEDNTVTLPTTPYPWESDSGSASFCFAKRDKKHSFGPVFVFLTAPVGPHHRLTQQGPHRPMDIGMLLQQRQCQGGSPAPSFPHVTKSRVIHVLNVCTHVLAKCIGLLLRSSAHSHHF